MVSNKEESIKAEAYLQGQSFCFAANSWETDTMPLVDDERPGAERRKKRQGQYTARQARKLKGTHLRRKTRNEKTDLSQLHSRGKKNGDD